MIEVVVVLKDGSKARTINLLGEKLTPKLARRALFIAFGPHVTEGTVWLRYHRLGYRVYPRSTRKIGKF